MFFPNWFRSKPEFEHEQIVRVDGNLPQTRFMVVKSRRWTKPSHTEEGHWVYDGPVFSIVKGHYVFVMYDYCYREVALKPAPKYMGWSSSAA